MKVYVASSWRNEHQQGVVKLLRDAGHEVYDFHERAVRGFNTDFEAMKTADACVLVMPCGRSAHLEAGWFIGQHKPTVILIPEDTAFEPELMYAMAYAVCGTVPDVIDALKEVEPEKTEDQEALPGVDLLRYWRDEFIRPRRAELERMSLEQLESIQKQWWSRVENSGIWDACRLVARTLGDQRMGDHCSYYIFVEEPDPARYPCVNLRVEAHGSIGAGDVYVHWTQFHVGDPANEARLVLDNIADFVTPGVWMDFLLHAYERAIGVKADESRKLYVSRRLSYIEEMQLACVEEDDQPAVVSGEGSAV